MLSMVWGVASFSSARRGHAGISVVEVLIAMAIFATAFLMLFGIFPTGLQAVQKAKELTVGTHIAENVLENAVSQPFASIATSVQPQQQKITMVNNGGQVDLTYTTSVLVTEFPAPDNVEGKNVAVLVTWEGRGGVQSVSLETDVAAPN